ncbi:inosine/xanthosine triphosphatase [Alteromonas pelagimontana]|uniref:inosine/xanthosine triphosphatase n=1 Tax=Alteromonas pelagimontana TaxID=1858656 RepID=A0A6M4ME03_9ALTE|nr:inosine/xanthosine triphosphatase [Alteromonas pelagimontana]QJR80825.1 inosine/xanthosine triphosphatase [Alteromonas pelagimontana]
MTVCIVGSTNPVKIGAAQAALAKSLDIPALTAQGIGVASGVSEQPMTETETRTGAVNRVNALLTMASEESKSSDWFVAIEGGVERFSHGPATFAYVAIYHQSTWSIGRSANLPLPFKIYQALMEGEELGPVMDNIFETENIKQKGGAIGLLTKNLATRQSVYELALTLAMAKFNFPQLYL